MSFDADRVLSFPLDGAVFDTQSKLFIFFAGDPAYFRGATVTFALDEQSPHSFGEGAGNSGGSSSGSSSRGSSSSTSSSSSSGGIFDFMGRDEADSRLAAPFHTSSLRSIMSVALHGCHFMRFEAVWSAAADGHDDTNRRKRASWHTKAKFTIDALRQPKVGKHYNK